MNKKANLYFNILEFLFLVSSIIFMDSYLTYTSTNFFLHNGLFLLGSITGFLFLSIELFLWILMTKKSRIFYIIFLGIEVLTAILINTKIPFSFIVVFASFSMIKNLGRIVLVNKIYLPREFNYYCRMFGVKIKDFKKKTVKKTIKKKEFIEIPVEEEKEEKPKRSRKPAKSLEERA